MVKQKPTFEAIEPDFGHSFTYQKFDEHKLNKNNLWHYHPELEIFLIAVLPMPLPAIQVKQLCS